jgi:hypothetical protein
MLHIGCARLIIILVLVYSSGSNGIAYSYLSFFEPSLSATTLKHRKKELWTGKLDPGRESVQTPERIDSLIP